MYIREVVVVGFALFAMFFGAGNLIFPTYLGVESGTGWILGLAGFLAADVGLAVIAVIASAKCDGDLDKILGRAGKSFSAILGAAIMICLGPLLAIPRTAATTYEIGIMPFLGSGGEVLFSLLFFIIVLVLSIKPTKVVDIIGSILTPVLLAALILIIVLGIIRPIGYISIPPRIESVFSEGITQGYQTMDALGAVALGTVIITSLKEKGFNKRKQRVDMATRAVIIAAAGLFIVYGGLTFLGASLSDDYMAVPLNEIPQTYIIVDITNKILGGFGETVLTVIITLACLTTAVGLTSANGKYFSRLTNNRLSYEAVVIIVCVGSFFISTMGVSRIIKISAPILSIIYPATVTLIFLTLFGRNIKNDNVFRFSAYTALIVSIVMVMGDMGFIGLRFMHRLPLYSFGFGWVVPAFIAGFIGSFIKGSKS